MDDFDQRKACTQYILSVKTYCNNNTQESSISNKEMLKGISDSYDLVIVGAGLSGAVIAEQASKRSGLRSLVIDKRDHIGGNCYDYIDEHGIRVSNLRTKTRMGVL